MLFPISPVNPKLHAMCMFVRSQTQVGLCVTFYNCPNCERLLDSLSLNFSMSDIMKICWKVLQRRAGRTILIGVSHWRKYD